MGTAAIVPVKVVCPRCECHFNHKMTVEQRKPRTTQEILQPYHLTPKEMQIATMMCEGVVLHVIAKAIGTTTQTVKNYSRIIYRKCSVTNRMNFILKIEEARHELVS